MQDDNGLASLLTARGGSAAERELIGFASADGTHGDRPKVLQLIDALGVSSDTCWVIARSLVRSHRSDIVAIAQALLEHGELSGSQIDELMRPSLVGGDDEAAG